MIEILEVILTAVFVVILGAFVLIAISAAAYAGRRPRNYNPKPAGIVKPPPPPAPPPRRYP